MRIESRVEVIPQYFNIKGFLPFCWRHLINYLYFHVLVTTRCYIIMTTMYSAKQAWCQAYQLSDSVDQHHSKAALIGYLCLVEI